MQGLSTLMIYKPHVAESQKRPVFWSINFGQDARMSLSQLSGSLRDGLARLWL